MSSPDGTFRSTDDKLIYMANQIGTFFKAQDLTTASGKVAEHIVKFWDPRMRKAIIAYVDAGHGKGLDPIAREAVESLRAKSA